MQEKPEFECMWLVGHESSPLVICVTKTHAHVVDVTKSACVGTVPLEEDTDRRVCFGPHPGTCLVGSWRKELKAWSYAENKLLWSKRINRIDDLEPYGKPDRIKIEKRGTIILDFSTGAIESEDKWEEVFFHPDRGFVNGDRHKGITFEALNGRIFQTPYRSFAMMTHTWSEDVFVWGSPEGHLSAYSWKENRLLFEVKPDFWFNVSALTYNQVEGSFFGIASDWKSQPALGLFSVDAFSGEIMAITPLPNELACTFLNQGTWLLLSDGALYLAKTGELLKRLDFQAICKG